MFSVITCSVRKELRDKLEENIRATIGDGVEFEFLAVDNAVEPRPIAAVYNEAAGRARFPYLLFIHEDAGFITCDWGHEIAAKLSEPDCGAIGFAGTQAMFDFPGGWGPEPNFNVANLEMNGKPFVYRSDRLRPFTEVVVLDGFAIFCRREVWQEFPFDTEVLNGFHCYDLDFTLSIATRYRNYVCNNVYPYHDSVGNFDESWFAATMDIYLRKWRDMLPMFCSEVNIPPSKLSRYEERALFRLIKRMKERRLKHPYLTRRFLKYPPTPRHLGHLVKFMFM